MKQHFVSQKMTHSLCIALSLVGLATISSPGTAMADPLAKSQFDVANELKELMAVLRPVRVHRPITDQSSRKLMEEFTDTRNMAYQLRQKELLKKAETDAPEALIPKKPSASTSESGTDTVPTQPQKLERKDL